MEKKVITKTIFKEHKRCSNYGGSEIWTWSEVQELLKNDGIELQDSDVLQIGYDEGFYSENNSQDPHYYISVNRDRPETDEEFEKRKVSREEVKVRNQAKRKELYLELKEEFG